MSTTPDTVNVLTIIRLYDELVAVAERHYEDACDSGDIVTSREIEDHMHGLLQTRAELERSLDGET